MLETVKDINTRFRVEADMGNIAKGAKSTDKISLRNNVHSILFYATVAGVGATRTEIDTDIDSIIFRYEGKQIYELTALQVLDLFKHKHDAKGALTTAGVIPCRFSRKDLPLAGQNNNFALGMLVKGKVDRAAVLTYEVKWKSPASLTIDSVRVFTEYDELPEMVIGAHIRTMTYTREFDGTGKQQITNLPTKDVAGILAYHFTSGNITKFSVKKGNEDIYRDFPVDQNNLIQREAGRTAQSGYTHICFDLQNDLASVVPLASVDNWLVEPWWGTTPGGSYSILAEQLHIGI